MTEWFITSGPVVVVVLLLIVIFMPVKDKDSKGAILPFSYNNLKIVAIAALVVSVPLMSFGVADFWMSKDERDTCSELSDKIIQTDETDLVLKYKAKYDALNCDNFN